MNPLRFSLTLAILTLLTVGMVFAQAVGDYGSLGTGNWGSTGANWLVCITPGTWTGATAAPGNPGTTTNVWIRNGHTVTLDASYNCQNLTIETGASLVGDQNLPSGTIRYLRVYGPTATINGVFGATSAPGTVAALEAATSSTVLTITGSGTFGPSRVRVNTAASAVTIVFDINTKFWFAGSTGTDGIALYPQTDDDIFTVNAGKTLTFADYSGLSVSGSNTGSATTNLTINVNGAIDLSGANSSLTLKVATGKTATMNIATGAVVTVGGNVSASTTADGGTTVMTVNGSMTAGGTVDFSNSSLIVTGTGAFTVPASATLMIGHANGIASSGSTGQIQTTTRSFSPGASYSYVGVALQNTGTGLPSVVDNLTINNAAGVTLTNATTVDTTLTLTLGNITTVANTLSLASSGTVARTSGHIVGNLRKNVATGSGVSRTFEIGTGTTYAPVSLTFGTVSTAGNVTASTTAGDHPNIATSNINAAKSVNRYWTLSNSGVAFTTYDATFHFVAGDIDPGASPGVFIAQTYSGSWSSLTMGTRGSTSTQITGASAFGDFAVGEAVGGPPAPAFELSSSSLNFGNVGTGHSAVDSVVLRNIGTATLTVSSITSNNTPVFTVLPASATVAAGDSVSISVTFTPASVGLASGGIVFVHNAAGSPNTLSVSGTGTSGAAITSNGTGIWSNAGTWQGGVVPTSIDSVVIRGTDSVAVTSNTSCAGLNVQSGGKLAMFAKLTPTNVTLNGTLTVSLDTLRQTGTMVVGATGTYNHGVNGGRIPTATWGVGSTLLMSGVTANGPDNAKQTFYNIIWNCPAQTTTSANMGWQPPALGDTTIDVMGNITVINTNTGRWNLCAPLSGTDSTHRTVARVVIHGNVVVSGGQFSTNGSGNSYVDDIVTTMGNMTVTGGNLSISRGSQGGGTGTATWYVNGDFSMSNATTQNSNGTAGQAKFVFNKPGTQTLTMGAGNTINSFPFKVASGTTLNAGSSVVSGSGIVIVDSGATIQCSQVGGIDSTFAGTGARTLSPFSNYTFNGSALQRTGRRLADTLNTLTINNSAGVTLSDSILVNGTLSLANGHLDLNGKMITLGPSGLLSETAGNTVTGTSGVITTTRILTAPASSTDIAGMGVGIGSTANLGSTVITRGPAVQAGAGSGSIKRYFDITPTINTGLNATLVFKYDDSELNGLPESGLLLYKSIDNGTSWSSAGGTVNTTANTITLSGVNDLSRWTASASSTVNINTNIASGWNMISNPVTNPVPDDSARHLFPTIASRAFEFVPGGGYQGRDTMGNRKGYWGKFPGATTNVMTGSPRTRDTISVVAGWNMVGSISNTVDTATIVQIPGGIKASNWFGFVAGYAATSPIVPGKAYWVKAGVSGKFVFANPPVTGPAKVQATKSQATQSQAPEAGVLDGLNTLTIMDSKGGSQTLYFGADAKNEIQLPLFDMPPAPPVGAMDARFVTSSGGSMVQTHPVRVSGAVEFPVQIQSDAYPVTVTWKMNGGTASYEMTDGAGGRAFQPKEMKSEGSVQITNSEVNRFSVKLLGDGTLPEDYALSQNYPNPFNPTTSIRYALPVQSRVTAEIYNVLGQRVRTLVNDDVAAGYHATVWDGTGNGGQQLASGVYFLHLSAKGTNGKSFSEVRKLMMLK